MTAPDPTELDTYRDIYDAAMREVNSNLLLLTEAELQYLERQIDESAWDMSWLDEVISDERRTCQRIAERQAAIASRGGSS